MEARSFGGVAVAAAIAVGSLVPARAQRGGGAYPDPDPSYKGDSVATWDGDTLVIDTTNFNDETWLGWPGYFHSDELHVIEKLTRTGNTIPYEVVVEDPRVLQKPWVWNPRMIRLNTDPNAAFWEDPPCKDEDLQHIVTKERG